MNDVKVIRLSGHEGFALVDVCDFDSLAINKWHYVSGYAYRHARINGKRTSVAMHREIARAGDLEVDHINGHRLDCTRRNLRPATGAQQTRNRNKYFLNSSGSPVTSRFKGVYLLKGKWIAKIRGERIGCFESESEAACCYNEAAKKVFGEFAKLNQI